MLRLLLCPIKWEDWTWFLSSCAGRSLIKEFVWSCSWTVTSRSDSGGLLLLSRCFPRALTTGISLCCGVGGRFPVNTEAYWSYPDSQHHGANTTPTLVLSVPGGEDPLRPWIAMSLQQHFLLSPRLWPAFQHGAIGQALLLGYLVLGFGSAVQVEYGCLSGCFAGQVNHSGNCYQNQGYSMTKDLMVPAHAAGVREGAHVQALASGCVRAVSSLGWGWWPLMDEGNKLLRGIAPPKGAVRTQLSFWAPAPCTCRVCCGSVISQLWGGSWHRWDVSSRLSPTLNSSHSLLQCCCKQRLQETCGAFRTSQLLAETK